VLADWDGVRAPMAAAWLAQLGAFELFVHTPEGLPALVTGPEPVRILRACPPAAAIGVREAAARLEAGEAIAFDVERRAAYERRHAAGARFCVPDRLGALLAGEPQDRPVLILSGDGTLAGLVAARLAACTARPVFAVSGGTQAWVAAGLPTGSGGQGVLSGDDDAWFSPYAHAERERRDEGFRAYLAWEIGLVEQLARDGTHAFRVP